jgi:hypothetical protein
MKVFGTELLTEKGNLLEKTVTQAKAEVLEQINLPITKTPNGAYALVLGEKEDGTPVYLTVSLTVGFADPFIKHEKKAKAKAEAVEIKLNLFGNAE